MIHPDTPVLIGVAELTDRPRELDEALAPLELLRRVACDAASDAGLRASVLAELDEIYVVKSFTEPLENSPEALARAVGASRARRFRSTTGGNTPQSLVNHAAERIARGEHGLVLLAGAEAQSTWARARREGVTLDWSVPSSGPPEVFGTDRMGTTKQEHAHGLSVPAQSYPLFENALRHHYGHTPAEHAARLAALCARFSAVAAGHPGAWFREALSAKEIGTPSPRNRPIALPYPKRMNAMNAVNQAAAVLLTSVARARALGVEEARWVYLHGCADAHDHWYLLDRVDYVSSPAIARMGREALAMAETHIDAIAHVDLYSCFPCAVEIARDMLGIAADDPRPLTMTGGLAFHGGAGNDYTMHAVATLVKRLREEPRELGLVTGNGYYLTIHSCGIYGARPSPATERGEPWARPSPASYQRELDAMPHPLVAAAPEGRARIETYTVVYDRDGRPERGIVVGRLADERRFVAHTPSDAALLADLVERDAIGMPGMASAGDPLNLFTPD